PPPSGTLTGWVGSADSTGSAGLGGGHPTGGGGTRAEMTIVGSSSGLGLASTGGPPTAAAPSRTFGSSSSTRASQDSQRACMGRTSPPPTPTIRMPAAVARTATSTGVVTVVATPTWLSAATTPSPTTNQLASVASSRPYGSRSSAAPTSQR